MPSSSTLEIVSRASNLVTTISDVPALSVLKPIGGILRTICDHLSALEDNKEAVIQLAKRVNQVVEVLTNRTQNLDGIVPGNYSNDIQRLESVLVEIATALEKSRQRPWLKRKLAPNADTAKLNSLSSGLDYAITMFGLSANIEARLTYQTVRAFVPNGDSEVLGPAINLNALQPHKELYETVDYLVQVGTYDNQAVVIKKYYRAHEERFMQDLGERRDLIHSGIARVIGASKKVSVMLFCAEDLILCPQSTNIDIGSVRDPWKRQRIGPQIASGDVESQSRRPPSTSRPSSYPSEMMHAPFETLTIKESAALLQQFIDVVRFLGKMQVEVAWWEFKPSWVGLRGKNQLILIDWDQDTKSSWDEEFQPPYAIHVMGLGFSDILPEAFQNSGRLLRGEHTASPRPGQQGIAQNAAQLQAGQFTFDRQNPTATMAMRMRAMQEAQQVARMNQANMAARNFAAQNAVGGQMNPQLQQQMAAMGMMGVPNLNQAQLQQIQQQQQQLQHQLQQQQTMAQQFQAQQQQAQINAMMPNAAKFQLQMPANAMNGNTAGMMGGMNGQQVPFGIGTPAQQAYLQRQQQLALQASMVRTLQQQQEAEEVPDDDTEDDTEDDTDVEDDDDTTELELELEPAAR